MSDYEYWDPEVTKKEQVVIDKHERMGGFQIWKDHTDRYPEDGTPIGIGYTGPAPNDVKYGYNIDNIIAQSNAFESALE